MKNIMYTPPINENHIIDQDLSKWDSLSLIESFGYKNEIEKDKVLYIQNIKDDMYVCIANTTEGWVATIIRMEREDSNGFIIVDAKRPSTLPYPSPFSAFYNLILNEQNNRLPITIIDSQWN